MIKHFEAEGQRTLVSVFCTKVRTWRKTHIKNDKQEISIINIFRNLTLKSK